MPRPQKLVKTRAMQSQWNDKDAKRTVETYAGEGANEDIALRVYTTRLIGRDPLLVLHGGCNTSVKTRAVDDLGTEHKVIAVKGSGADTLVNVSTAKFSAQGIRKVHDIGWRPLHILNNVDGHL